MCVLILFYVCSVFDLNALEGFIYVNDCSIVNDVDDDIVSHRVHVLNWL